MIMIAYFDVMQIHTPASVMQTVAQIDKENEIVAVFSDNTMRQYNRKTMYDFEIAEDIYDYIREIQNEMNEMCDQNISADDLDAMYQAYLDEADTLCELEDAKMHHWCT